MANRKRSKQVLCRLTDEEYDAFNNLLQASGLTSQDFVRKCITTKRFTVVQKVSADRENAELGKALFQLSKIGTNMNQIARQLNTNGVLWNANFKSDYVELLRQLKRITADIREVIENANN